MGPNEASLDWTGSEDFVYTDDGRHAWSVHLSSGNELRQDRPIDRRRGQPVALRALRIPGLHAQVTHPEIVRLDLTCVPSPPEARDLRASGRGVVLLPVEPLAAGDVSSAGHPLALGRYQISGGVWPDEASEIPYDAHHGALPLTVAGPVSEDHPRSY